MAWRAINWTNWTRRTLKKGAFATKRASGRSRAIEANASSISRTVLALKIWICSPMTRAAASVSRNVGSVFAASAGLTRTARRAALGTISSSSSIRLVTSSAARKLTPVRLPPGRARLATRPSRTGSSETMKMIDIVLVVALAADAAASPPRRDNHVDASTHQVSPKCRQPVESVLSPAVFDRDILGLDKAGIFEALAKCAQTIAELVGGSRVEKSNNWHRRLLCLRRHRPRRRRAAEQRQYLAPFPLMEMHLIPQARERMQDSGMWEISQRSNEPHAHLSGGEHL